MSSRSKDRSNRRKWDEYWSRHPRQARAAQVREDESRRLYDEPSLSALMGERAFLDDEPGSHGG